MFDDSYHGASLLQSEERKKGMFDYRLEFITERLLWELCIVMYDETNEKAACLADPWFANFNLACHAWISDPSMLKNPQSNNTS